MTTQPKRMPLPLPDDHWVEIPACRFRIGLEPDEMQRLAQMSATYALNGFEEAGRSLGEDLRSSVLHEYGDPAWVRAKLEAVSAPYDVDIPAFAIARRPVTNELFRQFIAEVGGSQPAGWTEGDASGHLPVRGVTWSRAVQFAQWAGARLPFEAEWERAARGLERRLFPWGNAYDRAGRWTGEFLHVKFHPAETSVSRTPEGVEDLVTGQDAYREWCADVRPNPSVPNALTVASKLHLRIAEIWGRATRGGSPDIHMIPFPPHMSIIPSAVARTCDVPEGGMAETPYFAGIGFRLVRADGRQMPTEPPVGPWPLSAPKVIEIESRVVRPVLDTVDTDLEFHRVRVLGFDGTGDEFDADADRTKPRGHWPIGSMIDELFSLSPRAHSAHRAKPDQLLGGNILVALSMETFRRVIPQHGVFLWQVKYRISPDVTGVLAHPVAVFRMAHDRQVHVFHYRFEPERADTPIERLTPETIRRSIKRAFEFYEEYADADHAPDQIG